MYQLLSNIQFKLPNSSHRLSPSLAPFIAIFSVWQFFSPYRYLRFIMNGTPESKKKKMTNRTWWMGADFAWEYTGKFQRCHGRHLYSLSTHNIIYICYKVVPLENSRGNNKIGAQSKCRMKCFDANENETIKCHFHNTCDSLLCRRKQNSFTNQLT